MYFKVLVLVTIYLNLSNAYAAGINVDNMPLKEFDREVEKCNAWLEYPGISNDSTTQFCECATEHLLRNYSREEQGKWTAREKALKWKSIWNEECAKEAEPIKDAQYSILLNMCTGNDIKDLEKNHGSISSSKNLRDLIDKNCACRANELTKYDLDEIYEWTVGERKTSLTKMEKNCEVASIEVASMLQCLESNNSATPSIENEKYCLCFIVGHREAIQNGDIKLDSKEEKVQKNNDAIIEDIKEKCAKDNEVFK